MCASIFCVGISSVLIFWKWSSWQTVNRQIIQIYIAMHTCWNMLVTSTAMHIHFTSTEKKVRSEFQTAK